MGWSRAFQTAAISGLCALYACSGDLPAHSAADSYSADFSVLGDAPLSWKRSLASGAYLVETRESDVGIRLIVDAAGRHAELEDEIVRYGSLATVVTVTEPGPIRIAIRNLDHLTMKGAVALRIVRLRDADACTRSSGIRARDRGRAARRRGCSTGEGRELRGGGVLGLTHGFLGNGSRSVVASLWPIEDAPTARFMEEFYAAHRVCGRAAEALRIAQLRTRNGPAKAVWSSFVVRANELP